MPLTEEEKIEEYKKILNELREIGAELQELKKVGRPLMKELRDILDENKKDKILKQIDE